MSSMNKKTKIKTCINKRKKKKENVNLNFESTRIVKKFTSIILISTLFVLVYDIGVAGIKN